MSPVARSRPDWLDTQERISWNGSQRWRSPDGKRIFTYDHLHGHIEVFNRRGVHMGVADVRTGQWIDEPVPGRRIDV
ncbi:colicin E3/pyocin S6 family cytotoxin [Nocardia sp. NPDC050412]|uniref:colicin E3/pyocin S6 family cytotoxin n=1 Tax=Nocardia sp. NPDC050412 TaxID=3364320 RepID=UPI0037AED2A4